MISKDNKITHQKLNLPKGGGAIKSLGESFSPNLYSGTSSFSIPIPLSEARSLTPDLDIAYNSANGNGIFGLGFSLSIGQINRKTNRTIPRYNSEDVFLLNGVELVPKLTEKNGDWKLAEPILKKEEGVEYVITEYLLRTEGSFSKIQSWSNTKNKDQHWRITSADGTEFYYGLNTNNRITHPENNHIFSWLLHTVKDRHGNEMRYHYKAENTDGIRKGIHEQNRFHEGNRYIKEIEYGNYLDANNKQQFAFKVIFDYGEHTDERNPHLAKSTWKQRKDSFSTFRSGFELRTHRLCQRILVFHQFKELGTTPTLVRSVDLTYDEKNTFSILQKFSVFGYQRSGAGYKSEPLPPIELKYTTLNLKDIQLEKISFENGKEFSVPSNSGQYIWADLYGEGIPSLIHSDDNHAYIFENRGNGTISKAKTLPLFPNEQNLANPSYSLQSLEGNGLLDFVVKDKDYAGYYEMGKNRQWNNFKAFQKNLSLSDNTFYADLNEDGKADAVTIENNFLRWFPSKGKEGFDAAIQTSAKVEQSLNDSKQIIVFGDLFGDGMSHRIKIGNGQVESQPHLGYGKFGKSISFENAPFFEDNLKLNQLHLADIDGNGLTDLIYVYTDHFKIWFNQNGNGFSEPVKLSLPQSADQFLNLQFLDLKGNGTSCLCLIYQNVSSQKVEHRYYDFCGGIKPYLLEEVDNNRGTLSKIKYTSSTQFYLKDKKAGKQWANRLPFPINVVEKTEAIEQISGTKMVQRYAYHHGYYDSVEREFRGFGCVEQWDAESFEQFSQEGILEGVDFDSGEKGHHLPPVKNISWFHTGVYEDSVELEQLFRQEYYSADKDFFALADSVIENFEQLDPLSRREAYTALSGQILHSELYAEDNIEGVSEHPFTVSESNSILRVIQPKGPNQRAVFQLLANESIQYHYERNPRDPRISHEAVLETNSYGQTLKSIQLVYPRRKRVGNHPEQEILRGVLQENKILNETQNTYRLGVPYESKTYEIGGLNPQNAYFNLGELKAQVQKSLLVSNQIRYDQQLNHQSLQARLVDWQQLFYWDKDQKKALPLTRFSPDLLVHHVENAVAPIELFKSVYQNKLSEEEIEKKGKYIKRDGYWWNPGLIQHYSAKKTFYLPTHTQDAWGYQNKVFYDPYFLSVVKVVNQLKHEVAIELDYRTLQAWKQTDINDNVSELAFDVMGRVQAMSIYGTEGGKKKGDKKIKSFKPKELSNPEDLFKDPNAYLQGATTIFFYDTFSWMSRKEPALSIVVQRETHESELENGEKTEVQIALEYSDGMGRSIQKKVLVEAGEAFIRE
ncbi:MAG: hypothetical protein MI810_16550 [Flavobacteriales bacterium]|nr:hypothetical protein [Flavobacteriales bacterium]